MRLLTAQVAYVPGVPDGPVDVSVDAGVYRDNREGPVIGRVVRAWAARGILYAEMELDEELVS